MGRREVEISANQSPPSTTASIGEGTSSKIGCKKVDVRKRRKEEKDQYRSKERKRNKGRHKSVLMTSDNDTKTRKTWKICFVEYNEGMGQCLVWLCIILSCVESLNVRHSISNCS